MQYASTAQAQRSERTEENAPELVNHVADHEMAVALEAPHERLVRAVAERAAVETHLARPVIQVVAALLVRASEPLNHLRRPHAHHCPVVLVRVFDLHAHHQRRQRARVLVARAPATHHASRITCALVKSYMLSLNGYTSIGISIKNRDECCSMLYSYSIEGR